MASFQQNMDQWKEILNRLSFDIPPVAFKFFTEKPEGIDKLDKKMFFCEMIKTAHEGKSFYADQENHECVAGLFLIGKGEPPTELKSGIVGSEAQAFDEPRACRRVYEYIPMLAKGAIQYVAFSPLDKLSFEPDLLILVANLSQASILLRAMSYGTGKKFVSQFTHVMACAWIFNQPYLTGEINYITTGISMGMTTRKVVPKGLQLISIPYLMFPTMLDSLQEMPWEHPAYQDQADADEWLEQMGNELPVFTTTDR